jgi:hypothetical protein
LRSLALVWLLSATGCSANGAGDSATPANGASGSTATGGGAGAAGTGGDGGRSASGGSGGLGVAGSDAPGNSAGASSGGNGGVSAGGSAGSTASAGSAGSAGTSSGNPCAARPGLLFCDDFESATVGMAPGAPWSTGLIPTDSSAGTVQVDDSVPGHSGSKSVHVYGSDNSFQTLLVYHDPLLLPQPSGKFYFRAFVRFGQPMTSMHNTFVLADLFANPDSGNVTRVGEDNGMLVMTVGGDAHGYNDMGRGAVFPVQMYTCLEMMFDAPNQAIDVWVNGVEAPDLHATDIAIDNYDSLRFGFEKYAGPASDFWFDDIAIGTQQIGCD